MALFEVLIDNERVNEPVDTADEAKNLVHYYKMVHPAAKVRMRKVTPEQTMIAAGHLREQRRMSDGTYTLLPEWFPVHGMMYVHLAMEERRRYQGYVAYSPDDTYLAEDRQLVLPCNTYLARHHTDLPPETISALTQRLVAHVIGVTYEVTGNTDKIYEAYRVDAMRNESSSSESCMKYSFGGRDVHPCNVYGDGASLHLAIGRDRNGTPVSRAVVCTKRRVFVRVYGISETFQQGLIHWLENNDYERDDGFNECTIKRLPYPGRRGSYIMPYIDGSEQCVTEYNEKLWVISDDGDYEAAVTGGYITLNDDDEDEDEPLSECDHCGDTYEDGDGTQVATTEHGYRYPSEVWCPGCARNHTWTCERTDQIISDDVEPTSVEVYDGTQQWVWCAVENAAFYCEYTRKWFAREDFTEVEVKPPAAEARLGDRVEMWCFEAGPVDEHTLLPYPGAWTNRPNAGAIADRRQPELCPMSDE